MLQVKCNAKSTCVLLAAGKAGKLEATRLPLHDSHAYLAVSSTSQKGSTRQRMRESSLARE